MPRIIEIYTFVIPRRTGFLDILQNATPIPSGSDKISVTKKMIAVIPMPESRSLTIVDMLINYSP